MPSKPSESLLFHKKKVVKKEPSGSDTSSLLASPRKSATPRQMPKPEPDDEMKLPEGKYSEFKLMSSALNGWKYDVMKFDSRKSIDVSTWESPIRLNRKESRREEVNTTQVVAGPMLGPDGKPVIGPDGKAVMVDADGRPIHNYNNAGEGSSKEKDAAKGKANGRKKFQKKTRQVFLVPEATRQLRREERYPWVMEDGKQKESPRRRHTLFFMPAETEVFKFVPAHRWYKFQKKPNYHVPNLEEAESIMAKIQKNKDPERWLLHNRNGKAASSATSAIFKAQAEGRVISSGNSLVHTAGQSLGPGNRKLKTVDREVDGLFGDDDDEGGDRRRKRENDGEGDLDENEFEEEFADDEEAVNPADNDDEEAKELEERLKREYKNANKQREGYIDESEEEDDDTLLTKDGKNMKKLIRNLEKNTAYESDEERNPYASSDEEEEEEEPPVVTNEPAIQQQPQQINSRSSSQQPSANTQSGNRGSNGSAAVDSRANSPVPATSPGLGGHSVVAKRATSPKAPKLKSSASRGSSPLSGGAGSRATSPVNGSRATSPTVGNAASPSAPKLSNKRKATDDLTGGAPSPGAVANGANVPPKPKKRKPLPGGSVPTGELEDRMLVEWLKNTTNATTRDCIQHFQPYLTDEAKKSRFTALVKEVAQLKGGVLILKNAYREGSSAASPGPV
ncbi:hypothetical protein SERLA73DRAFT_177477 [Serpula lacrymans var. lacrymans S7.3]|uniref:Uncharacterized protein n=1 Tax=Serpula lacrymans var. lacrymans (strain S7.3) TaxID=936435 RepID=F8PP13_SERL3|nr:hypothetical protein SERLA73DRAFT_177477 [Serpula lacrymans var. lacrymans S7.3]